MVVLIFVRPFWRKLGVFGALLRARPRLVAHPKADQRRTGSPMSLNSPRPIQRRRITLHNVRNCDYRTETDFTPRWETRTVRLSQITGIDLAINYWGSPWMAHPIASFQFADAPPVCFSIETRKKTGQTTPRSAASIGSSS